MKLRRLRGDGPETRMSNTDRDVEVDRVVSQHEQAKRELVLLQTKVKQIGAFVYAVETVLLTSETGGYGDGPPCAIEGDVVSTSLDYGAAATGVWPTAGDLAGLMAELQAAIAREADLERQRRALDA